MTDLERAKNQLDFGATCAFCRNDNLIVREERGIKPLFELVDGKTDLSEYSAADLVVGRAAAFLYLLSGVSAVYARTVSVPAKEILEKGGISVSFGEVTDKIMNRNKTGLCPMEEAVLSACDPSCALEKIRARLAEMRLI